MKILLGISGSIAAYKSAFLVRLWVKEGHDVKVVLTPDAAEFVTPLTLSTLSKNPVHIAFADKAGNWVNHVDIALGADAMVIAPATANTISKMANGLCDNLLLATYLSAVCPVYVAPAMDRDMYIHPAVKKNLETLKSYGVNIINPDNGELASGLYGEGRMAQPEAIVTAVKKKLPKQKSPLSGKKVLITAGPTYEPIDPVRFIGNHSSGKMGFALAENLAEKGAEVFLVAGPVNLNSSNKIKRTDVSTAQQMYDACMTIFSQADVAILAAAVADYKVKNVSSQKIKKNQSGDNTTISLEKNPDILEALGKTKKKKQVLVGFSLETHNEKKFAAEKLRKKNCDMIVLNSLKDKNAGFGFDTNKIFILTAEGEEKNFTLKSKKDVAEDIINFIATKYF